MVRLVYSEKSKAIQEQSMNGPPGVSEIVVHAYNVTRAIQGHSVNGPHLIYSGKAVHEYNVTLYKCTMTSSKIKGIPVRRP